MKKNEIIYKLSNKSKFLGLISSITHYLMKRKFINEYISNGKDKIQL